MNESVKPLFLYSSICVVSVIALLTGLILQAFWPDWRWHDVPLHSTIETLGGLAAVGMAIVLLHRTDTAGHSKRFPIAGGFFGMGILEMFHAISPPGNGFVLLRSMASLVGGLGFALVWLRISEERGISGKYSLWLIAAGTLAFGVWILGFPERLPVMMRQGEFTPTAIAPKSVACILFLAGAVYFLLEYRYIGQSEDILFACLALMFGLAELMFTYSTIWDGPWWFWHFLRLTAYLLVLGYVGRGYLHTVSHLQHSLAQTKQVEDTVRRSESRLREVLEEREHLAQDLHDGAIQSLFTLGLSLERCQRLIPKDPKEAISKVGAVIADLKLVIRDLRNFISGTDPDLANSLPLEEAIASLVRIMNHSSPYPFVLQVDRSSSTFLSPAVGTDVLYILKEAMSNSLRHAQATSGSVSLQMHNGSIRLEIEDDGLGFDTADVQNPGNGLRNMTVRARRLGARLEVLSKKGKGTRIIFEIHKKDIYVPESA